MHSSSHAISISPPFSMNHYSVHQVDIENLDSNSAYISWRMIGNTCPMKWDFVLGDWGQCFDGMPTIGDLLAKSLGNNGLIKFTANPYNTPGSGFIHFLIFPTGFNDILVDLSLYFDTGNGSVGDISPAFVLCT